jgi:hypothetical protein
MAKNNDFTEEEQALMKSAPYVMKPLHGSLAMEAACFSRARFSDFVALKRCVSSNGLRAFDTF